MVFADLLNQSISQSKAELIQLDIASLAESRSYTIKDLENLP